MKPTSLFISKSKQELNDLVSYCELSHIELTSHSFLSFKAIPFQLDDSVDCVFFSSPRAVNFYLASAPLKPETLIAVAGQSTAKSLEQLGYHVHFIPSESGKVEAASLEFSNWLGSKSVLFPISSRSNKSYSQFIHSSQIRLIEVYETIIEAKKIPLVDCFVFTSPSNVKGFFMENELPKNARVIAWGESTLKSLNNFHKGEILTLNESSENELIRVLNQF